MKKILYITFFLFFLSPLNSAAQFALVNNASITEPKCSDSSTTYLLTPNLNYQAGQIWYITPVSLTHRFDIQFEMYLGAKPYTVGADGICFVFQQQSINAGGNGGGLGFSGITPSIAVEFDTFENYWDPPFCHTAIEKNGDVNHTDNSGNNLVGPLQLSPGNPNLPDNAWHHVEIIWNPITDSLSMYFDCVFRVAYDGDIIDSIFGGNPNVYWGFTAGTGGEDNNQEICIARSYLNYLKDTTICQYDSVKLTTSGGVSYQWSPAKWLSNDTGQTVYAKPDITTTYTVTIKNSCGVITKDSTTITVNPTPSMTLGAPTNLKCNGVNTGTASVTVLNGNSPYTYLWSPAGGTSAIATGLSAGTYTVTVSGTNGCGASGKVTITQPPAITTSFTSNVATCIDTNGSISVSVSGGISPYTYLWSPGGERTSNIKGLSSGKYTVTIVDANGCIDTASGNVGINKTFSVSVTGLDTMCKGQNAVLSASGATNYKWSTGSTSSSVAVSPASTTNYWVVGSTGICKDSIPYTIDIYPPLVLNLLNDSICPGAAVKLQVTCSGGKPTYTYTWSNGITSNSPGPIKVFPTSTTTYSITITDECNYKAIDSARVTVFPIGSTSFYANPDTLTNGQIVQFTNTSHGINKYYWYFGDGGTSGSVNPSYSYPIPGNYQVVLIGYNSYGCIDSAIGDIYVAPKVIIPNVFTPNGDGTNDEFYFTIRGAQCFNCNIYNRWGILVYQSNDIKQGWDGKIQQSGELASDGTYYYLLNYCDYKNDSYQLAGFLELIRNK
jgi:gliding motility-associated-like protein